MNIIQCKMCRKPFHSVGGRICSECLTKIDGDFVTVRDYLYENNRADIDTVSEKTGVDKAVILYLLKEGRLTIENAEGESGALLCEVCKKPISTGRMCDDCKGAVASTMQKTLASDKPPEPPKKDLQASKYTAKMHTNPRNR